MKGKLNNFYEKHEQVSKSVIVLVLILGVGVGLITGWIFVGEIVENQAQETGEEYTDEVSEKIFIDSVLVENSTQQQGEINKLHFDLQLAGGTNTVDLQDATISIATIEKESVKVSDSSVSIEQPTLTEQKNRTTVTLNLNDTEFGTLSESETVTITVDPQEGRPAITQKSIPSTIQKNSTYVLP